MRPVPILSALALALAPVLASDPAAAAGALTAQRTLAAGTILSAEDVVLDPGQPGALDDPAAVIGKQLRTTVYEGRPILPSNIVVPTLVERNQTVEIAWTSGALTIATQGRALGRGGAGDVIRVLNTASRVTLTARINPDGTLAVLSR